MGLLDWQPFCCQPQLRKPVWHLGDGIVKKISRGLMMLALSAIALIATSRNVPALTIDFIGTSGGIVEYFGGASGLHGVNLPISSVFSIPPGFSSNVPIIGGLMNFTTGSFISSTNLGGGAFVNIFGASIPGIPFSIAGAIPTIGVASGTTLLAANFATNPTFLYLGAGNAGSFSANLFVTYVYPTLASYFGLTPMVGSGFLTQLQMNLFSPITPGAPLFGNQASANIVATIREPATLLLLGSGLTILGLVGMRRSKSKETDLQSRPLHC